MKLWWDGSKFSNDADSAIDVGSLSFGELADAVVSAYVGEDRLNYLSLSFESIKIVRNGVDTNLCVEIDEGAQVFTIEWGSPPE